MKKNAIKELRDKDTEALTQELEEKKKQLFALRSQAVTQKLEDPRQVTKTRHEIARIYTLLGQRSKGNK